MGVAWPLKVSANGRYLVDQRNVPFRIHGFAFWDGHIALSQTDWRTALDNLVARGINAVHTYLFNSVPYMTGGPQPLNNAGQKPWTQNTTGGAWSGNFANSDAAFDHPNDAYFTTVASFVDDCAARGILVIVHFMYAGANHITIGDKDGWWACLITAHNTTSVCTALGAYLANGSTTFTGFATSVRPNIMWLMQGDSGIGDGAIGSAGSTNMQAILTGLKNNGATQLVTQHVTNENLPNDMTDYASLYDVYAAYTAPSTGETYVEVGGVYTQTPTRPTFLIESNYWGERGVLRHAHRYTIWGAAISAVAGAVDSFGPLWGFFSSTDGTTGGVTTDCLPNCWVGTHAYSLNAYAHLGGNWYRCITAGTSASLGGPSGTGSNITDNTVHWAYVAAVSGSLGGMGNLFDEPGMNDHKQLGQFFANIGTWHLLVPSGQDGTGTIVKTGNGTQTVFTDGSVTTGTADWIVASAGADGANLVAYVPNAHSGAFTVDMTRLYDSRVWAYWVDPVSGQRTSHAGVPFANTGTRSFTVPGANAGGDSDWVLHLQCSPKLPSPGVWT
jgi:hypothetical protein